MLSTITSSSDGKLPTKLARSYQLLCQLCACRLLVLLLLTSYNSRLAAAENSVLLGQKQEANKQYCFYRQTADGYRLLTPHSLARADLLAAARAESVNMSKAFNFVSLALFPAGVACGGTGLMWIGVRKRFGYAALLSCAAVAALVVSAKLALAEEDAGLQQALDALLAGKQQSNSRYHAELFRVLRWLGSDDAVACPRQPSLATADS